MPVFAQSEPANITFWNELKKLCDKSYSGTVAAAPADDATFKDKALVMHVRSCEADRIRIPFVVGADRSRTWVMTRKGDRIELRHDHRHEDGKPDKVTMYGGWTTSLGSPTRQMFPADQQTVDVIAAAASTNAWWIDLVPGEHFSYNLRRMGSERYFSIKFDLKTEVKAPEAPWGWKDGEGPKVKISDMEQPSNPAVYFEIPVTNVERAVKFYSSVFGFAFEKDEIDGNEMALFPFIEKGDGVSGALAKGKTYKPSKDGTLIYLRSEDIDATLKKVQQNGGKVLYPKTSIGELGFVAEFEDSEGNRIALHTAAKKPS